MNKQPRHEYCHLYIPQQYKDDWKKPTLEYHSPALAYRLMDIPLVGNFENDLPNQFFRSFRAFLRNITLNILEPISGLLSPDHLHSPTP